MRQQIDLSEISEFITAGIEIGQQIVAMAGPACLKDLGLILTRRGMRTEALIRSGRVIFLTAPDCLAQLGMASERGPRAPLRLNGSVLRWVSDWSWAYGNGHDPSTLLRYQCLVHDFVRALTPLSLCTVHGPNLERSSLLAMMADHRRAARASAPRIVAPNLSTKPAPVPLL